MLTYPTAVLGSVGTRFGVLCVAWAALLSAAQPPAAAAAPAQKRPPNIVYVLADDLSWDLLQHMPQVRKMQRQGMTFDQFVVADSLCCSSRATILTGQFPHNTKRAHQLPARGRLRRVPRLTGRGCAASASRCSAPATGPR